MNEREEKIRLGVPKGHSILIKNHENCIVNGVENVLSFDEESVSMLTAYGALEIAGSELHITKLDLDSGQVIVTGSIDGAEYADSHTVKGKGLFSKLFR